MNSVGLDRLIELAKKGIVFNSSSHQEGREEGRHSTEQQDGAVSARRFLDTICRLKHNGNVDGKNKIEIHKYCPQYLWIYDTIKNKTPMYNIPVAKKVAGELNVASLLKSFSDLVYSCLTLRTTYHLENDRVYASIVDVEPGFFRSVYSDISDEVIDKNIDDRIGELCSSEYEQPFDLGQEIPVRIKIVNYRENEHIILITFHHCAVDGWSANLLIAALCALYNGERKAFSETGKVFFSYLENPFRSLVDKEEAVKFWKRELEGAPARHSLERSPTRSSIKSNIVVRTLPKEVLRKVEEKAVSFGSTLVNALHAFYAILLAKKMNEEKVVIGSPVANRKTLSENVAVGSFVNTVAFQFNIEGNDTISDIVKLARDKMTSSYHFQSLPFGYLVEKLDSHRSGYHPIFQILFVCQHREASPLLLKGCCTYDVEKKFALPKFDLALEVILEDGCARLEWQYNPEVLDQEYVRELGDSYLRVIDKFLENPSVSIATLSLADPGVERRLLTLSEGQELITVRGETLPKILKGAWQRFYDRNAVVYDGHTYTYRDLFSDASSISNYIKKLVPPKAPVAIHLKRGYRQVVCVLAVVLSGRPYIPIDISTPKKRARLILDSSGCDYIFTEKAIGGNGVLELDYDKAIVSPSDEAGGFYAAHPDDLAYIIYTSGTTGVPKGVAISHGAVCNTILSMNALFEVNNDDCVLAISSLAFDLSVYDMFGTWAAGATLIMLEDELSNDPREWRRLVFEHGVTIWNSVPACMQMLIKGPNNKESSISSIRAVWLSGDWVPPKLIQEARKDIKDANFVSLGGATEGAIWSIYHIIGDGSGKFIPYGLPLPNQGIYVLKDDMSLCPFGEAGNIYIAGDGLAKEYWHSPEKTEEAFIFHPVLQRRMYRTGDLGRWNRCGYIEFLGRKDHQIKMHGYRIELGDIEAAIRVAPFVNDAVVIKKEGRKPEEEHLEAYIICANEPSGMESEIRSRLSEELPRYMHPSRFIFLDEYPLNKNGKVDRARLVSFSEVSPVEAVPESQNRDSLVGYILAEVLGVSVEDIRYQDGFLEQGGTSLLAVSFAAEIYSIFGKELHITDVVDSSTIFELIEKIESVEERPLELSRVIFDSIKPTLPTIIIFHAAGGHTGPYNHIIDMYEQDFNFVRVESPWLFSVSQKVNTYERLVSEHLKNIIKLKLEGPTILMGWSLGGQLALSLSDLLQAHGLIVDSVLAIDPPIGTVEKKSVNASSVLRHIFDFIGEDEMAVEVTDNVALDSLGEIYDQYCAAFQGKLNRGQFETLFHSLMKSQRLLSETISSPSLGNASIWIANEGRDTKRHGHFSEDCASVSTLDARHYDILSNSDFLNELRGKLLGA